MARYNREELYEKVWTMPVRDIAKEYGVSDVAIGKTCRKLLIPLTGKGYWAKKAANQPVRPRPPLQIVQISSVMSELASSGPAVPPAFDGSSQNESLPSVHRIVTFEPACEERLKSEAPTGKGCRYS
jgi:hypothetical protein